jgi:hypothetical protein
MMGYFNCIFSSDFCSKKLPYPKDSNQLPSDENTEMSITNTNNCRNTYTKKFEILSNHVYLEKEKLSDEKSGEKVS